MTERPGRKKIFKGGRGTHPGAEVGGSAWAWAGKGCSYSKRGGGGEGWGGEGLAEARPGPATLGLPPAALSLLLTFPVDKGSFLGWSFLLVPPTFMGLRKPLTQDSGGG